MSNPFKVAVAAAALLAAPGIAQAQASSDIALSSTVAGACGLGAPTIAVIDLLDLTGPDGRLDPSKTSDTMILGSSAIQNAWCNSPSTLEFSTRAMELQSPPSYAQPSYMSRDITYSARLVGWSDPVSRRPKSGDDIVILEKLGAYAAPNTGLVIEVRNLETLTASKVEQPNLMLEAGSYKGTVKITLAPVN